MPTTLTKVDLFNIALDHVNEKPLSTVNDDNAYARFLARQYPNVRDSELRKNNWNFAITYHSLTKDGTNPDFRWLYRYALPSGWLRLLPPTEGGKRGGATVPHEVVGGYVYTDRSTPFYVRCVSRNDDPGAWDPNFAEMVSAMLGIKMALRFTGKNSYLKTIQEFYAQAYADAVRSDALEGTPDPAEATGVITARYTGS